MSLTACFPCGRPADPHLSKARPIKRRREDQKPGEPKPPQGRPPRGSEKVGMTVTFNHEHRCWWTGVGPLLPGGPVGPVEGAGVSNDARPMKGRSAMRLPCTCVHRGKFIRRVMCGILLWQEDFLLWPEPAPSLRPPWLTYVGAPAPTPAGARSACHACGVRHTAHGTQPGKICACHSRAVRCVFASLMICCVAAGFAAERPVLLAWSRTRWVEEGTKGTGWRGRRPGAKVSHVCTPNNADSTPRHTN